MLSEDAAAGVKIDMNQTGALVCAKITSLASRTVRWSVTFEPK